ncbi:MAG TPA: DMT family transporter [Asticcacaulis sp.]|nr:DMT family transporter [Asticcacaulis sp.]
MRINPRLLPVFAVLCSILSVQAGASFSKHLFPILGAEGVTALRQLYSTLLLLLVFRPWQGGPARKDWGVVMLYGGLLGVMNLTFYLAIERLPLGIGVALEFLGPLAVAILSSRQARDFVWVACAVAGLALLIPWGGHTGALDPVGVAWALVAALCWGLYIIVGQKVSDRVHGGKAVALGMAFSLLLTLPVGVIHSGAALWAPSVLPWAIAVAVLSSAIPYSLEMMALKHIPAKTFGLMMSLEPAAGALLGFLIIGEQLSLTQCAAIALVIIASAGSSLTARRAVDESLP